MRRGVILMRGVSGSGKSTVARQLVDGHPSAIIVSADDFFVVDGHYLYDRTKIESAHRTCLRKFIDALQANTGLVIVDNTNVTELHASPYMAVAEAYEYDAIILRIQCDWRKAQGRNRHGVSMEQAERQALNISRELPSWWKAETFDNDSDDLHV